jgi:hypothetical protein
MDSRIQLVAGIILFIAIELLKPVVFAKIDATVAKTQLNDKPLPDIGHATLPDLRAHYKWGNIVSAAIVGGFVVFCLWTRQWTQIVEVFFLWSVFLALKLGVNAVTILPDPSGMCKEKEDLMGKFDGQCNDLMPSGHMALVASIVFSLWGQASGAGKAGLVLVYGAAAFVTIAARNHYTIDVVVSAFVVHALRQIFMVR